eukprot:1873509-Pyramimonas_sp.AAC.1
MASRWCRPDLPDRRCTYRHNMCICSNRPTKDFKNRVNPIRCPRERRKRRHQAFDAADGGLP